jgi:DNA-binding NtrC family response regulator
MPAQVVVVLREHVLANKTAEALINAGYEAIAMHNSMAALQVLETARSIELLITSAHFPGHQPNGRALVRMTRMRRPELKVIFANGQDTKPHIVDDDIFIPTPTDPLALAGAAEKLLHATSNSN